MSTGLAESKRLLLAKLAPIMEELGFSARKRFQSFERKFSHGRQAVHLSFITHDSDFDVTVDVGIRFDLVEELLNRENRLLSSNEKKETFTLGAELGNIRSGKQLRFPMTCESDLTAVADDIRSVVEQVGIPYLEEFSSVDRAYEVLASDDQDSWLYSPLAVHRAKSACAMLVVMGRPAEVPSVAEKKRNYLKSIGDPQATTFDRFVSAILPGQTSSTQGC